MKCIICNKTIGEKEHKAYILLYKDGEFSRRIYACLYTCNNQFDRLIDLLPTDNTGRPQTVSKPELAALLMAASKKGLEKRLRQARSVLYVEFRNRFGRGKFDFENRRLIGNNERILQWQIRSKPDEPISPTNQQTSNGVVKLIKVT